MRIVLSIRGLVEQPAAGPKSHAYIGIANIMNEQTTLYASIPVFALNDDLFKSGSSMIYFNELQDRIREIRISERFFYQKIKDIYTTSIDCDPKDEKTLEFFKKEAALLRQPLQATFD